MTLYSGARTAIQRQRETPTPGRFNQHDAERAAAFLRGQAMRRPTDAGFTDTQAEALAEAGLDVVGWASVVEPWGVAS